MPSPGGQCRQPKDSEGSENFAGYRDEASPPKGRWLGVSRVGGDFECCGLVGSWNKTASLTIPQSASLTAPFAQGSLPPEELPAEEGAVKAIK